MKFIVLLLTAIMTTQVMGIETLKYDVLKKDDKIEIRRYKEHITASVTFDNQEEFDKRAFRTLADYIFGNNISMTSPVLIGEKIGMTAPVLSDEKDSTWTMSFSMPERYTMETLPTPKNKMVKIKKVEEKTLAAIRFSGFMSDSNFKRNEAKLKKWLDENNYDYQSDFVRAGYNPPWTLPFFRRNEILSTLNK